MWSGVASGVIHGGFRVMLSAAITLSPSLRTERPFEPAYVVFWVHRMRWSLGCRCGWKGPDCSWHRWDRDLEKSSFAFFRPLQHRKSHAGQRQTPRCGCVRLVLAVRGSCEWSAVLTDVAAEALGREKPQLWHSKPILVTTEVRRQVS